MSRHAGGRVLQILNCFLSNPLQKSYQLLIYTRHLLSGLIAEVPRMAWALLFLTCDVCFSRMFLKLKCDSASVIHSPSLHSHKRSLAASQGGPCPQLFNISHGFSFTQLCPLPTGVVLPFTEPLLSQVGICLFQMTPSFS